MKKLMVAIAAVASAFGLYASELEVPTGTSFEYLEAGSAFDKSRDDFGGGGATWWFSTESEVDGTILAYGEETPAASRPEKFDGETQYNYLALESTSPLYRGASEKTPLVQTFEEAFTPFEIGATGLYIDQTVKFTAPSDSDATVNLDGGKIAVWLKESGSDDTLTTNLMVTAGYFTSASSSVQKDYVVDFDATTLLGSWHRVTIKTINITDNYLGFIVYIDGVAVATEEEIADDLEDVGLSALAKKYAAEKKLFPSAVIKGIYAQTVAAVGYNGSGSIDDVSITPIVPAFAKDGVTFDLDWDPAAFTSISAGGQDLDVEEGEAHLDLDQATSLKIVAVPNDDYTISLKPGSGAEIDPTDEMTFIFGSSASGSIVAAFNYFEGADGTTYPTFAAALEAAEEGDTIKLNKSCTLVAEEMGDEGLVVDKEITFDLAGNNLLVDDDVTIFTVTEDGVFTVVNSGNSDARIGMTDDVEDPSAALIVSEGSYAIGTAENEDKYVVLDGYIFDIANDPVVYQGKFNKDFTEEKETVENNLPAEGEYVVLDGGNYWIAQLSGLPPPPTTYTVSIVEGEGTVLTVTTEDGTLIEDGDPVDAGTVLTISVEAEDGYKDAKVTVNGDELKGSTYTVNEDVEIASEATELELWLVWIGDYDEDKVESFTADPMEVREDAEDKTITLTATFKEGFELDYYTVDGEKIEGDTFELDKAEVTVSVVAKATQGDYPPEWPDADPDVAAKFAAWSAGAGKGADLSTDAAKNAFLLNVSVEDYEASNDLTIKSIDVDAEGYAAIEISIPGTYGFPGIDLAEINGVLHIEAGDTLDTLEKKAVAWWFTENGNAIAKVKYNFIKAIIGFQKPEVDAVAIDMTPAAE